MKKRKQTPLQSNIAWSTPDRIGVFGYDLPRDLIALMARCDGIYERVRRLDESMYGEGEAPNDAVAAQMARLHAAFARA